MLKCHVLLYLQLILLVALKTLLLLLEDSLDLVEQFQFFHLEFPLFVRILIAVGVALESPQPQLLRHVKEQLAVLFVLSLFLSLLFNLAQFLFYLGQLSVKFLYLNHDLCFDISQ